MTNRARVTQGDMARAVRAAHSAPVPCVVEIAPDGTIRIVPVDPSPRPVIMPAPWTPDQWLGFGKVD
jgi:hypothetical protein